ncbi:hypothetical protein ACWCQQ_33560 [Streptomyces sp. NPDC002143]
MAASFAVRPMLCELFSAQVGVLEHNISIEVATRYKEGTRDSLLGFAELLRHLFPELDQQRSEQGARPWPDTGPAAHPERASPEGRQEPHEPSSPASYGTLRAANPTALRYGQ